MRFLFWLWYRGIFIYGIGEIFECLVVLQWAKMFTDFCIFESGWVVIGGDINKSVVLVL